MTRPNARVSLRASNEDECLGGLSVRKQCCTIPCKKGLTFTQCLVPWHLWFSESRFSRYTSKVPGAYTFSRKKPDWGSHLPLVTERAAESSHVMTPPFPCAHAVLQRGGVFWDVCSFSGVDRYCLYIYYIPILHAHLFKKRLDCAKISCRDKGQKICSDAFRSILWCSYHTPFTVGWPRW